MVAIEGLAPAHAALARAARAEMVPAVRPSCSSATRPPGCCESHFSVLIPGGELGGQYRHTLPAAAVVLVNQRLLLIRRSG
jgi:hypothetical protein